MTSSDSDFDIDFYISTTKEGNKPYRGTAVEDTWRVLKNGLTTDWVVGYRNYPFQDYQGIFEYVPDIILLHADIGFCIINCLDIEKDEIKSVGDKEWVVQRDAETKSITTLAHTREQKQRLFAKILGTRGLEQLAEGELPPRISVLALPNISRTEWDEAGFGMPNDCTLLFEDDLSTDRVLTALENAGDGARFSDEEFQIARDQLNQGNLIAGKNKQPINSSQQPQSKRDFYRGATSGFEMHEQDKLQEEIAIHIPEGPQQIRGIAGSGKTTIMAKKGAIMHLQNPDWNIAFTFNTRSLYQTVGNSISRFYTDLSMGDKINPEKFECLHAWGQEPDSEEQNHKGLYRKIAIESGIEPYRIRSELSDELTIPDKLGKHCEDLLEDPDVNIPQIYDAILIDEAQDFHPSFYKLCYAALKEPKRLIWAYDEAQNLSNLSAPSPKEIFGTDEDDELVVDLSGSYKGGIKKSHIMSQSYRTPRDVLMAAHAIGMGLYAEDGIVHTITEAGDWRAIGYEVDGNFNKTGSEVRIRRDRNLSPHPLQSYKKAKPFIKYEGYDTIEDEIEGVIDNIITDLTKEQLAPERIMLIILGPPVWRTSQIKKFKERLDERADEVNNGADELAHLADEGNRNEFRRDGKVTLTGINRAKGNEAASVHLCMVNQIDKSNWEKHMIENDYWRDNYVNVRNELFVGITRSEGWCSLTGHGSSTILQEAKQVVDVVNQTNPELTFAAPDPSKMDGEIHLDDSVPTDIGYFND